MQNSSLRTLFIINPVAGIKRQSKLLAYFEKSTSKIDFRVSEYKGHISEIFMESFEDYDIFVAVGGDGTFNELVSVAVNTKKIVAILPYGSGNGFARELGFTKNIDNLFAAIANGEVLTVDTLDVAGRVSVNVSGVGFDSRIAHVFHRMKRRGFWSYFFSTLKILIFVKSIHAEIKNKNFSLKGRFLLISVANTKQYGNNAIISPKANPFDGKFELLLIKPLPKILFPYFALKIFLGSLRQSMFVEYLRNLDDVEIITDFNKFHIDGEAVRLKSPVKIKIRPKSLNVLKTKKFK